jgi:nicotinate-nucleotide--dimethylbenzimidazole phosphoribosyltransferase
MDAKREFLNELAASIRPLEHGAMAAAKQHQDHLTKPAGSLGRLEELAIWMAGVTGELTPATVPRTVVVMAGDHGVASEGVSAYPSEVTPQMVMNFLGGGAAINVLARQTTARVLVVDLGVACELGQVDGLVARKVGSGTANIATGPAMSRSQALRALRVGAELAQSEIADGARMLATGEMGIGNTTPASALICALTDTPPELVVGRGTGLDDAGLAHKRTVVGRALASNRSALSDPVDALAAIGGYEIAGLVGLILAGAARRRPVVLDGFIAGAAALVAARIAPAARNYMLAGHLSAEQGHRVALSALDLQPLLDLDLRLGEGTGAVLAFYIIDAATRIMAEMATFSEASISRGVER